jgi:bifunctional DNA-binding transcriptional regulator/antitoxin component of YhaV-PrlF toxin-antitoxin module
MHGMTPDAATSRVSNRGQTSVPACLRHRWGIAEGGDIVFLDLGVAALVFPNGIEDAQAEVRRVLLSGAYENGVALIDDPDLADQ